MSLFAPCVRRIISHSMVACCMAVACHARLAPAQVYPDDKLLAEAMTWMNDGDYQSAMPLLLQSANHGHPGSMRQLGVVYSQLSISPLVTHGDASAVRRPDPRWGLQWFQRAALKGDVTSAFYIADLYAKGMLGKPDYALAHFWYAKDDAGNDAHGPMGLAELACSGAGEAQDLGKCNRLLLRADSLHTADGSNIADRLAGDWHALGASYQADGPRQRPLAAAAYRHAGALGDPNSAIAESNLFLTPGDGHVELPNARAALDSYVATFQSSHPDGGYLPGKSDIAAQYVLVGQAYEKLSAAQTAHAVPVYAAAAKLGISRPAVQLALRYANGEGVPRSVAFASQQLLALDNPPPQTPAAREYIAALEYVARVYLARGDTAANRARAKPLLDRADKLRHAPPVVDFGRVAPAAASMLAPVTVQERYPNLIAPPTVAPLQKFPVMVSLNTAQFDKSTVLVSGGQADGEIQVTLPAGMTAVTIEVNLIAPAMTSVDGMYTQSIELTKDQDSTTAVFQLQAGATPANSPIFATLLYNGAFLAEVRRDVTVAAATAPADPPQPAPLQLSSPRTLSSPSTRIVSAPAPVPATPQPPVPAVPKIRLDPEQRAPDMTIQEVQVGDSLSYTVYAPGFGFAGPTLVTGAAQRQAIIAKLYSDLENQGNVLDQIGGASASQQARDFAEGKGNDLYDQMAPDAFKTTYQKMMAAGSPPRTIQVLTSSPSLPWELLRPVLADGTRQDFLGTSVAIVTGDAASTPRVPPPLIVPVKALKVVAPHYDGDLSLAGAQQEVIALKSSFPALDPVDGSVDAVSALGRNLPDGIIHYAGHGIRATTPGLPPDVALSLSDGTMAPSTWKGLAEQNPNVHPFYFFNACDLGQSDATLNYITGWAPTLMQSGASGYLGALWKVSDTTATSFANHFYKDLKSRLAGSDPWSVAEVVTQARQETYQEAFDPTALAYILYADPYETMADQE